MDTRTLSILRKLMTTSYVTKGSKDWRAIAEGVGWKRGRSMGTWYCLTAPSVSVLNSIIRGISGRVETWASLSPVDRSRSWMYSEGFRGAKSKGLV